ncbi:MULTISPECIES: DUF3626 domain-containing protein [unclassified Beijerinckia]|uniref:DUF3626 domain-containing protein n=1 Tax=unclassified Beijerinckia TaxID=2638183 RepID=UPI001FCDA432|nr:MULTISPECIES: DUF3626 domain-containing protein [unclassified Beijerinckia]
MDPVEQALAHLRQFCTGETDGVSLPITMNFHPDIVAGGENVIELLARHDAYRSQFETGTSSGGLTAHRGGDRWSWESRIFGGAYDKEAPSFRPKYGALNHRNDPVGGSRRFGSSHMRLRPHVRPRTSFCYPDSYLEPKNFAVGDARPLIVLAEANASGLDPWLDNYIEAHVHGPLRISEDVEAIVLDPSFRNTVIEESAASLGCRVEWHDGFRLPLDRIADCEAYRGPVAANAIGRIAEQKVVTPAILWRARDHLLDYQTAKWVWHCIARYGHV